MNKSYKNTIKYVLYKINRLLFNIIHITKSKPIPCYITSIIQYPPLICVDLFDYSFGGNNTKSGFYSKLFMIQKGILGEAVEMYKYQNLYGEKIYVYI